MMFITTVPPTAIDDRIAAESNAPEFAHCARKLASCGMALRRLGDIVTSPINNSIRDVAEAYRSVGGTIPLFRPVDMKGAWLDPDTALRISREFESQHEKARVVPGNIVIAAAGTVARAAQVPVGVEYGAINGSCARVVVPKEVGGYVLSYLSSRYGFLSLMRWAVGSVQKHLNLEDLPRVSIPWPDKAVVGYINDKVRQAERLHAGSLEAMHLARQLIETLISKGVSEEDLKSFIVRNGVLHGTAASLLALPDTIGQSSANRRGLVSRISGTGLTERLDAGFYQKEFLENEVIIHHCGLPLHPIGAISEKCNCGATPKEVIYRGTGQGLIRTTDVRPNVFLANQVLRTNDIKVSSTSPVAAIANDILYTMSGTIGYAAVIPDGDEVFSFSNTIARARLPKDSDHDAHYIAGFFNSSFGYKQSLRLTSGGIQGHVMPNPFKGLLVPTPSPTIQKFIGDLFRKADRLGRYAGRLVTAAKELVTALIENHVSEADLQVAQRCLEKGDQELDRAILARLSANGIDVAGSSPLFPDADSLYAAIEDSKHNDASNGDDA